MKALTIGPRTIKKQHWGALEGGGFLPTCDSSLQVWGSISIKSLAPRWPPHLPSLGDGLHINLVHVEARSGHIETRCLSSFSLEQVCRCRAWVLTALGCAMNSLGSPEPWMGMGSLCAKLRLTEATLLTLYLSVNNSNILVFKEGCSGNTQQLTLQGK